MSSQIPLPNSTSKSRDVDGSLYLLAAAIAGLVLFFVFLLGGGMSSQQAQNNSLKKRAVEGIEIVPRATDIGFQGQ